MTTSSIVHKEIAYAVVGAAMEVHRMLGPGFLEAVYQRAMAHELSLLGIHHEALKQLPVTYKGVLVGVYQADFVVAEAVILELKSCSALHPQHEAQAIHYLTATGLRLAILLNFGTASLQYKRIVK
jgi:GxxExxY protein